MCEICDAQRQCWNKNFSERPSMFGDAPSDAAQRAFELLKREDQRLRHKYAAVRSEMACGVGQMR